MPILLVIIISTILVSLLSLAGAIVLTLKENLLKKIVGFLVDLSVGILLGVAFLDLIPEVLKEFGSKNVFLYTLIGFFAFFLIEKILHWRHCHEEGCAVHSFAYINLLGESVHNFADGMIIATSFVIDYKLGVATTLAVILHEIPHEMGNFGILMYAGFSKTKALLFNFSTGLTAILGGLFGFYLSEYTSITANIILPIAAGGFIYVAASDLIPEGKKEKSIKKSLIGFAIAVAGAVFIYLVVTFLE